MQQAAVNARVVLEEAERLTAEGYQGDATRYVEQLLIRAISLGYRRIEPPPPLRGTTSTPQARREALDACAQVRAAAKTRRTGDTR